MVDKISCGKYGLLVSSMSLKMLEIQVEIGFIAVDLANLEF